jgi:hypothetical protein
VHGVDFLNLEYLLLRVYHLAFNFDASAASTTEYLSNTALALWVQITIAGLSVSLILFLLFVWFRIRLEMVEHAHHHELEHAAADHEPAHEHPEEPGRWERILALAGSSQESDWRRAILEADIMLGEVLTERGYLGESIGEQLRTANPLQFRTLDLAWRAHKMRNEIAHRGEAFALGERDVRATIDLYRRVFEEFEVL